MMGKLIHTIPCNISNTKYQIAKKKKKKKRKEGTEYFLNMMDQVANKLISRDKSGIGWTARKGAFELNMLAFGSSLKWLS